MLPDACLEQTRLMAGKRWQLFCKENLLASSGGAFKPGAVPGWFVAGRRSPSEERTGVGRCIWITRIGEQRWGGSSQLSPGSCWGKHRVQVQDTMGWQRSAPWELLLIQATLAMGEMQGWEGDINCSRIKACPWADLWCKIMSTTSMISFTNLSPLNFSDYNEIVLNSSKQQ